MCRALLARAGAILAGTVLALAALASPGVADSSPLPAGVPGMAEQLRYIGRDTATGMPAPIDEQFIAAVERAVGRYGKDEQRAEPPPPVSGADLATVVIPRLGVRAAVARFGVDQFGRLDVPQDASTIAWHPAYSALPGEGGATFVAAHFEYRGVPGVFNRLATMAPGDDVVVVLSDGSEHRYRVTSTVDYALAAIDMGALLRGREGVESLVLMTCSGPPNEGEYAFRTVVLAERAPD